MSERKRFYVGAVILRKLSPEDVTIFSVLGGWHPSRDHAEGSFRDDVARVNPFAEILQVTIEDYTETVSPKQPRRNLWTDLLLCLIAGAAAGAVGALLGH